MPATSAGMTTLFWVFAFRGSSDCDHPSFCSGWSARDYPGHSLHLRQHPQSLDNLVRESSARACVFRPLAASSDSTSPGSPFIDNVSLTCRIGGFPGRTAGCSGTSAPDYSGHTSIPLQSANPPEIRAFRSGSGNAGPNEFIHSDGDGTGTTPGIPGPSPPFPEANAGSGPAMTSWS